MGLDRQEDLRDDVLDIFPQLPDYACTHRCADCPLAFRAGWAPCPTLIPLIGTPGSCYGYPLMSVLVRAFRRSAHARQELHGMAHTALWHPMHSSTPSQQASHLHVVEPPFAEVPASPQYRARTNRPITALATPDAKRIGGIHDRRRFSDSAVGHSGQHSPHSSYPYPYSGYGLPLPWLVSAAARASLCAPLATVCPSSTPLQHCRPCSAAAATAHRGPLDLRSAVHDHLELLSSSAASVFFWYLLVWPTMATEYCRAL